MGGHRDDGLKVVAKDFGNNVLDHCLLTQAGDVFEIEAVLGTFERFFDATALVIERAEAVGWKVFIVEQIGHQHAVLAIGQDVTSQAQALRLAPALSVQRILFGGRTQHDGALDGASAHELAHAGEDAVVSVDARAEFDGVLIQ